MNTIYCWVNSGAGSDWQEVLAMGDDGRCVAQHVSFSLSWAKHDIGLTSDWNHDTYAREYPGGYTLEWVDDFRSHTGLSAAYEVNQKLREPPIT